MKTVSEQMELARKAQAIVNDYTQEQIDEICLAIGWEVYARFTQMHTALKTTVWLIFSKLCEIFF